MDKSVQAISVLTLPVTLQQDTPAGTWVTATGQAVSTNELPLGVTQYAGKAGTEVSVTVMGTASMNLDGIATTAVSAGDVICFESGAMVTKTAATAVTEQAAVQAIVLYDAGATAHAEVLLK